MTTESIATQMKTGLRRLAKAVVVITSQHDGQRYAMAATAVSELSMDPPAMLICVNKTAAMHAALTSGAPFALNILHSSHKQISMACGGRVKGAARFETGDWVETQSGVPRLADAQSSFVCRNVQATEYGSHTIFIGLVEEVFSTGEVDPLVYVDGRYVKVGAEV